MQNNHASPARGSYARKPGNFNRTLLPNPADYYIAHGLKLTGGGEWKSAVCPFHNDTHPSLRVRLDTGAFKCMVCGAGGGDVLAYHMRITSLPFIRAAKDLSAWEGKL